MWILLIYIYAGVLANGDSVTLLQVQDSLYKTEQECKQQEQQLQSLVLGTSKRLRVACIKKEQN